VNGLSEFGSSGHVLLQTHNVAMVRPLAEYVVSLGLDGRVAKRSSASVAVTKDKALAVEPVAGVLTIKDEEENVDAEVPDKPANQADGKLIVAEEIAEGRVSWDACNYCSLPCDTPETHPIVNRYSQAIPRGFGWIPRCPFLDDVPRRHVALRCLHDCADVVHGILGRAI
jgi:hypothetical protein